MPKTVISSKIIKFSIGGIVGAVTNLILMAYLVDKLGFDTPFLRNIANIISIEAGLITSFVIYRSWIWKEEFSLRKILFRQIPLYHVAGGSALLTRSLIIFPLLDWLAVNYLLNTFIGMIIGTVIKYIISDRVVFKMPSNS